MFDSGGIKLQCHGVAVYNYLLKFGFNSGLLEETSCILV